LPDVKFQVKSLGEACLKLVWVLFASLSYETYVFHRIHLIWLGVGLI